MNFDTIIIGGGLAGLVCAIRLQESGLHCAVVSAGQSALHFSSGSLDLLGRMPDGTVVTHPLEAVEQLPATHPYRKIGQKMLQQYVAAIPAFFERCGIVVKGNSVSNHFRITPMGTMKQTWLSFEDFHAFQNPDQLPWKKVRVVNFEGFLDFYTQFIADSFESLGAVCQISTVSLPAVEKLRCNPTEMRSANIARVFDTKKNIDLLIDKLRDLSADIDALVLPAVFGLSSSEPIKYLREQLPKPVCFVATMPPSVPGIRIQQTLLKRFTSLGGILMMGDTVERAEVANGKVVRIHTVNHADIGLTATNYVLASGSFFSRGIIARPNSVYEPIFNLDVSFDPNRENWYRTNVFSPQPYMSFGVQADAKFHPSIQGDRIENLFTIGSILACTHPMQEGSGAGVSILTAMNVAEQIVNQKK